MSLGGAFVWWAATRQRKLLLMCGVGGDTLVGGINLLSNQNGFHYSATTERFGPAVLGDDVIVTIWNRLLAEGKVEQLFYFSAINTPEDFLAYIKAANLHVCVVVENKTNQVRGIIWLTNIGKGTGLCALCCDRDIPSRSWPLCSELLEQLATAG
jgi:hypothetical protein